MIKLPRVLIVVLVAAAVLAIGLAAFGINVSDWIAWLRPFLPCKYKMEPQLYQISQSTHPDGAAAVHGISLRDGKIRVIIEVNEPWIRPKQASSSTPTTLIVETRHGRLVQALVSPSHLCAVAKDSQVRFISLPLRALLL